VWIADTKEWKNGEFRGANTPEQRFSVVPSAGLTNQTVLKTEKEGDTMKTKNNMDASQFHINWKHIFLTVLHLVVFLLSASSDKFITAKGTAGALP